jgi:hypothetical protein
MKTAHICFLWHMHQPYYTNPVAGSASMPWVRLHATKAYYDMAYGLEKFPSIKATFNFTPSLLRQLEEVGSGTMRDLFLEHAQRPAADLRPEEKAFLIRHFFSANWATMVRPYPRYHELLVKRGADVYGRDLERVARQFSTQDLLDLQTWHNLAWFGYGTVSRYPRLAALRAKNRGFTEEEKQEVLALQLFAVQDIVPLYRRLMEWGTNRAYDDPLLSPDHAAHHRYRLHSTRQTGSPPPLAIPCAGRCGDATATRRRVSYRHIRTGSRGPLAFGGLRLSRTDSDVAEGWTALAGNRRRHPRSLARRGPATVATPP